MKARIWGRSNNRGGWFWHYRARRGNVSTRGICRSWDGAMRAVLNHLEKK